MTSRLEREKEYHDQFYPKEQPVEIRAKYYTITQSIHALYKQILLTDIRGKQVLEYGCGVGGYAFDLAKHGAHVTGIDLSEVAINMAKDAAAQAELTIDFRVMNAENLLFEDNSFELICGVAILHHLQIDKAFAELARTLKPDGKAIFWEPLGHNPLINLYRHFTPSMRTPDEHPLRVSDLQLAHNYFRTVETRFFLLTALMAVPFRKFSFFPALLRLLDAMDRFLLRYLPFMRKYAWNVLLDLSAPIKDQPGTNKKLERERVQE